ncbi:unnamed protein product [Larinioides sclopetarius]|uniref:Uncharacterized protein n=1 Tax=Larinioides sclopetarius TaxID=280406 RepID=A0AAV1Z4E5_9ARAC
MIQELASENYPKSTKHQLEIFRTSSLSLSGLKTEYRTLIARIISKSIMNPSQVQPAFATLVHRLQRNQ